MCQVYTKRFNAQGRWAFIHLSPLHCLCLWPSLQLLTSKFLHPHPKKEKCTDGYHNCANSSFVNIWISGVRNKVELAQLPRFSRGTSLTVIVAPNKPSIHCINQKGKNKGMAKSLQSLLHMSDDPVSELENQSRSHPLEHSWPGMQTGKIMCNSSQEEKTKSFLQKTTYYHVIYVYTTLWINN